MKQGKPLWIEIQVNLDLGEEVSYLEQHFFNSLISVCFLKFVIFTLRC